MHRQIFCSEVKHVLTSRPIFTDMKKILLFLLAWWAFMQSVRGQDANFTQFYASPLYLNPALTGAIPYFRVNAIYRNQWSQIPNNYQINQFSADFNLDYYDSGIGILLSQDRIGALAVSITQLNFSYAYRVRLRRNTVLRMGIQGGVSVRYTDWGRFTFEDQLQNGSATAETVMQPTIVHPNVAAGAMLHRSDFWFGVAAFHLSRPSVGVLSGTEKLPVRFAAQAGYRIDLDPHREDKIALSPALLYQQQGKFRQLDIGTNFYYAPVIVGIWYRGLPIFGNPRGSINQDALAALAGIRLGNSLTVSYSYDITISSLNRSGGSHEISLIYQPSDKRRKRGSKHIDCPIVF